MSHFSRQRRRRQGRSRPRNKLLLALVVVVSVGGIGLLSAVGWVISVANSAPPLSSLKPRDQGGFSVVYARDGKRLGVIQANILRKEIESADIPQNVRDATIAIEDSRFYQHQGVDFEGIVRAAIKNLESGSTVQGGSTITMQLVRTLYGDEEESYERKIREAKLAEEYENEHTKDEILTAYLNDIPYGTYGGQTALGIWAAAKMYFDKEPAELTLPEAALLAGLPQAPSQYSPVRSPDAAKARRDGVLRAMERQNMISPLQSAEAQAANLGVNMSKFFQKRREGFFFDYVKDELYQSFPARVVRRGGLRVHTTIDLKKQEQARTAINGNLAGAGPSGAAVTINPDNGQILTMASSSDYGQQDQFNLAAQGHRQPGSAFKVMALMAAVHQGINPDSATYTSKPLNFVDPTYGPINVKTYSGSYSGTVSLTKATLLSDNSVYQQLALDVGPDNVAQTARDMGITSKLHGYPAETLGGLTDGVSPLEMATAYATIASGGVWHKPVAITKIKTADGTVLKGRKLPKRLRPESEKRFQDGVTAKVTDILQQNITSGTGGAAAIACPHGGKTGTTDEHSDGWFVGITPALSTAVWVGYPKENTHMYTEYFGGPVAGGTFPAAIWGDYMAEAIGGFCGDFPEPTEPVSYSSYSGEYSSASSSGTSTYDDDSYEDYSTDDATTAPETTAAPPAATTAPTTPDSTGGTETTPPPPPPPAPAPAPPSSGGTGGGTYDPSRYESPE